MALTPSKMMPLGTRAPDFCLPDTVSGEDCRLDQIRGKRATVIMFICNHCPYVVHVQKQLVALAQEYLPQQVGFAAISSNDVDHYPDDAPELMQQQAQRLGYPFVYLYDQSQSVARAYQAACTPDFYVFDAELCCVYRGRLDDSRPGNGVPVTGVDLRAALDSVLKNQPVSDNQEPSVGCNIKWKPA